MAAGFVKNGALVRWVTRWAIRVARTAASAVRGFSAAVGPALGYSTAVSNLWYPFRCGFFITVTLLRRHTKLVATVGAFPTVGFYRSKKPTVRKTRRGGTVVTRSCPDRRHGKKRRVCATHGQRAAAAVANGTRPPICARNRRHARSTRRRNSREPRPYIFSAVDGEFPV